MNILAVPLYQGSCREIPWRATSYDLYLVICRFDTLLCVNDSMWHVDDILCLLLQGHILSVTYALNITAYYNLAIHVDCFHCTKNNVRIKTARFLGPKYYPQLLRSS